MEDIIIAVNHERCDDLATMLAGSLQLNVIFNFFPQKCIFDHDLIMQTIFIPCIRVYQHEADEMKRDTCTNTTYILMLLLINKQAFEHNSIVEPFHA